MKITKLIVTIALITAVVFSFGACEGDDLGEIPLGALVFLSNGAEGNNEDGIKIGGSGSPALIIVFPKMVPAVPVEIEFAYTKGEGGNDGINIEPALTTNIPFTSDNGWGNQVAGTPQNGKKAPSHKWTPATPFDILKISGDGGMSSAGTIKNVNIKLAGVDMTIIWSDEIPDFSTFKP